MRFVLSALALLCTLILDAQMKLDSIPGKQVLIDDLYALKSKIIESHPNPYAFCSKQEFNEGFGTAIEKINEQTTFGEFLLLVADALQVLRDSHTSLDYGFLGKVQTESGRGIIPVRVLSIKGQVYALLDRDSIIPKGAHIHCINNIEASKLYLDALKIGSTEGDAVTGQRRLTDALFPLSIGLKMVLPDTVKIDYEKYGSDSIETAYYPIYKKDRWAERQKTLQKSEGNRMFKLDFHAGDSVAVLKIGTFAPSSTKKFYKFLKESFREINEKNVQVLAIDIRDNGGGRSSNVEQLFAHLTLQGHNTPANIIGKSSELAKSRSKWASSNFARWYLRTFQKRDEDIQGFLKLYEADNGTLDTIYFQDPVIHKKKFVYTGKTMLFINGMTASAGVDITNAFYKSKRGEIIGEPCLGPHSGTFGNPSVFELPKTKLPVIISTIRYNYDNSFQYDRLPIKPNISIELSQKDLAENNDPYLQYLLQSIRK